MAWYLPPGLVYAVMIRAIVHATTGPYGNTEVPTLTAMRVLQRWEKDYL